MLTDWSFFLSLLYTNFINRSFEPDTVLSSLKVEIIYFLNLHSNTGHPMHGTNPHLLKSKISMYTFLFEMNGCFDLLREEVHKATGTLNSFIDTFVESAAGICPVVEEELSKWYFELRLLQMEELIGYYDSVVGSFADFKTTSFQQPVSDVLCGLMVGGEDEMHEYFDRQSGSIEYLGMFANL